MRDWLLLQLGSEQIGTTLLRLLIAALCGGFIGIERGRRNRPAGLRTHMLVCIGSALVMLTNQQIADLSRRWPGTIFEVSANFHRSVQALHAAAVPHYSAAILAAAA